jgi:hypothetical protein
MKQMNHMFQVYREEKNKINCYETYESYVTSLKRRKNQKFILMKPINHM